MKIELGKRYICRNKSITGPLIESRPDKGGNFYPFKDPHTNCTYTPEGKIYVGLHASQLDICHEYLEKSSFKKKNLSFLEAWQAAKDGYDIKGSRCSYIMSPQEVLTCSNWGKEDFEDTYEIVFQEEVKTFTSYHTVYQGLGEEKSNITVGIGYTNPESAVENLQYMPSLTVVAITVDENGNFVKGETYETAPPRNRV